MYSCPLHNWNSFYDPCPSCFVTVSSASTGAEPAIPLQEPTETEERKFTLNDIVEFTEWAFADDINPFVKHNDRWIQACGNSTSWSTEQLINLFLSRNKF